MDPRPIFTGDILKVGSALRELLDVLQTQQWFAFPLPICFTVTLCISVIILYREKLPHTNFSLCAKDRDGLGGSSSGNNFVVPHKDRSECIK